MTIKRKTVMNYDNEPEKKPWQQLSSNPVGFNKMAIDILESGENVIEVTISDRTGKFVYRDIPEPVQPEAIIGDSALKALKAAGYKITKEDS